MHGETGFTIEQTHGILARPGIDFESKSDDLGWSSLYVSCQRETPYRKRFDANQNHLMILHRDGPVSVFRDLAGDKSEKTIFPGGIFIMPAGNAFEVELRNPLSTTHVYIKQTLVREAVEEMTVGDPAQIEIIPRFGETDECLEQLAHMAAGLLSEPSPHIWLAETLARTIAGRLMNAHSTATFGAPRRNHCLSRLELNRIRAFVEENMEESIKVADMARLACLSPNHFALQFRQTTNLSPYQYVIAARVERAKRLLRSDTSIAEIALSCGFSHQEHLTRVFGKMLGVSPGAYRRSVRH